jgi:hypothetical protein
MKEKKVFTYSWYFLAFVTLGSWALLLWDFTHQGVPSHHLLANKEYPAISNWWGGLTVPLLAALLVYRIQSRFFTDTQEEQRVKVGQQMRMGFFLGLLFAIALSVFFTLNYTDVPMYMLLLLVVASLFTPIYRAECLLGFVLGMVYTFGGVLPLLIGAIFSLVGFFLYKGVRPAILYSIEKVHRLTVK